MNTKDTSACIECPGSPRTVRRQRRRAYLAAGGTLKPGWQITCCCRNLRCISAVHAVAVTARRCRRLHHAGQKRPADSDALQRRRLDCWHRFLEAVAAYQQGDWPAVFAFLADLER